MHFSTATIQVHWLHTPESNSRKWDLQRTLAQKNPISQVLKEWNHSSSMGQKYPYPVLYFHLFAVLQGQLLFLDSCICGSSRISCHVDTLWGILRSMYGLTGMYFTSPVFLGLLLCYHGPFPPLGLGISYIKFLEESWGILLYKRKPLGWLPKQTTHKPPFQHAA